MGLAKSFAGTSFLLFLSAGSFHSTSGFVAPSHRRSAAATTASSTKRPVSQLDRTGDKVQPLSDEDIRENVELNIPGSLRTTGEGIPARNDRVQLLDPMTYESDLIKMWEDPTRQKGFDWEIEKWRRFFAGLRMREDGSWVRKPSFFEFLVSKARASSINPDTPKPVNLYDVMILFATTLVSSFGFGPSLGMAAVPTAEIQKYEGSFLSFIKGVLGGDLQTLAGGPLFLLLAKYYQDYGPIFNLAFGPKSFLVVSDPVMARHILRSSPEQYCKGMLAEILEPIMGKGLIPADPATWRVRSSKDTLVSKMRTLSSHRPCFNEGLILWSTSYLTHMFVHPSFLLPLFRSAAVRLFQDSTNGGSTGW